jgi:hypothetical protein
MLGYAFRDAPRVLAWIAGVAAAGLGGWALSRRRPAAAAPPAPAAMPDPGP